MSNTFADDYVGALVVERDRLRTFSEAQAREIEELKAANKQLHDYDYQLRADSGKRIEELRAALVSAIAAMEDFDYDKRMAAIAKCREVL